ncbi:MAG: hypothetical protein H6935_05610 [Thiobacillus sp.]|nr:hypothetical protein [Thiobacillus sp.]
MSRLIRFPGLLAVAALMSGCAAPRFETIHRYEPPLSVEAQACLKNCEAALHVCREECQAAWKACADRVEPEVEEHHTKALKDYAADLRLYRRDLDQYQWDLWLGWGHGYSGVWYSPWPYHGWPGYYPGYSPPPPAPGDPPTREAVRDSLRKSRCQDDCSCQPKYDACFTGCGGRVVTETRCIANCPAGQ